MMDAPAPYGELVEQAGFDDIEELDVTAAYRATAVKRQEATVELESGLRAALGDEVYEERRANRTASLAAIEAGELGRTRFVARAVS